MNQTSAGADPDAAVGAFAKAIEVAVVPDKSVVGVDVGPVVSIENVESMFCAGP